MMVPIPAGTFTATSNRSPGSTNPNNASFFAPSTSHRSGRGSERMTTSSTLTTQPPPRPATNLRLELFEMFEQIGNAVDAIGRIGNSTLNQQLGAKNANSTDSTESDRLANEMDLVLEKFATLERDIYWDIAALDWAKRRSTSIRGNEIDHLGADNDENSEANGQCLMRQLFQKALIAVKEGRPMDGEEDEGEQQNNDQNQEMEEGNDGAGIRRRLRRRRNQAVPNRRGVNNSEGVDVWHCGRRNGSSDDGEDQTTDNESEENASDEDYDENDGCDGYSRTGRRARATARHAVDDEELSVEERDHRDRQAHINEIRARVRVAAIPPMGNNAVPQTPTTSSSISVKNPTTSKRPYPNRRDIGAEEDDMEVLGPVVIIDKDPVSKLPIKNPMRNKICGHVYDRDSIIAYMDQCKTSRQLCQCPYGQCPNKQPLSVLQMVPYPEWFSLVAEQNNRRRPRSNSGRFSRFSTSRLSAFEDDESEQQHRTGPGGPIRATNASARSVNGSGDDGDDCDPVPGEAEFGSSLFAGASGSARGGATNDEDQQCTANTDGVPEEEMDVDEAEDDYNDGNDDDSLAIDDADESPEHSFGNGSCDITRQPGGF